VFNSVKAIGQENMINLVSPFVLVKNIMNKLEASGSFKLIE